jgi:hypothetical protein
VRPEYDNPLPVDTLMTLSPTLYELHIIYGSSLIKYGDGISSK